MTGAKQLALVRIAFFASLFFVRGRGPYLRLWSEVPPEFWHPNGLLTLVPHSAIPSMTVDWLFEFWRWTLPICALGLFYRLLAPLNWIAGFFLFNYAHSFGYQTHTYMPLVLAGLPLAFARAADAWSVDSRFVNASTETNYSQAIFNMRLVFTLTFFAAGLSKLRNSGIDWVIGDTLRNYFLRASIVSFDVHETAHQMGTNLFLYNFPIMTRVMAAFGLGLELLSPFALWRRPFNWLIIVGLLAMQIVIYFSVFVNFSAYLALYSCWLPLLFEGRKKKSVN